MIMEDAENKGRAEKSVSGKSDARRQDARRGDGAIPLLAGRIPNLRLDGFTVYIY